MSIADKTKYLKDVPMQKSNLELKSYCGSKIKIHGVMNVKVRRMGQTCMLRLFVVEGNRHPLLGREWMQSLKLNWNDVMRNDTTTVNKLSLNSQLSEVVRGLIDKFPSVFDDSVGKMENVQASLTLKPNCKPVFIKARTLPFSIKDIVEKEIEDMVRNGVLVKVNHSQWATPVVPVMKSLNKVRLCGDYKITVNNNLLVDEYPLPTID